MRVLVTGASGFIGSAITHELASHGHEVIALARSDTAAQFLASRGYEVHRGDLTDLDSLAAASSRVDGVVHAAFANVSATTTIADSTRVDRAAVAAIGDTLARSGRPFVVTSVTSLLSPEARGLESDAAWTEGNPRGRAEVDALSLTGRDVRVSVVRLPPSVHGAGDVGWVPSLIRIAKERGIAGYIGDGSNVWPAVHRLDAAALFRLALDSGTPGSRFHAVADEGVPMRAIAAEIGRIAGVPTGSIEPADADAHFGFLARFVGMNTPRSSAHTRAALGWMPRQPGLLEDLASEAYGA